MRTDTCTGCKKDDDDYTEIHCLECWRNPWMKDHYEEGDEEA